jgi:hypothetical protein
VSGETLVAQEAPPAYLIWSNEHRAWWRHDHCGYTSDINDAGWYKREEAIRICALSRDGWRNGFVPPEVPILLADATECLDLRKALDARRAS